MDKYDTFFIALRRPTRREPVSVARYTQMPTVAKQGGIKQAKLGRSSSTGL